MATTNAIKLIEDSEPESHWIAMSNALTRAGHGLSLSEKRLVMLAVSKLDSKRNWTADELLKLTTRVTASEYAETYGVDMDTAYDSLQSAAKHLYDRSITIFEPAYTRKGRPLKDTIRTDMRWVGECKYYKDQGFVELAWWHRIIPALVNLRQHFTQYQLEQTSALRSVYSWKLLELLMRFQSTGWAEYSIEDFCAAMDATDKQKANFNNIKRRIIEPAIKELCEKDSWIINWQVIKTGRKVTRLRFTFLRDPQRRLL